MSYNFTQGDWVIAGYNGEHDESGAVIKCNNDFICSTSSVKGNNWKKYYSNARLISSAPKMYDRLMQTHKLLLDVYNTIHPKQELMCEDLRTAMFGIQELINTIDK